MVLKRTSVKGRKPVARKRQVRAKKGTKLRLPRAMRIEKNDLNTYDVTTSNVSMDTTSATACLFFPTRTGNNYTDREGDRSEIVSILFKYTIENGSAQSNNANDNQYVRIVLYWDSQPNNAVPGGALPLLALTPLANPEPQYTQRFKILYDKVMYICGGLAAAGAAPELEGYHDKYYAGNVSLVSAYTGNAGSIADIQTGALNLLVLGDTAVVANENPTINYTCRCRFKS